MPIKNTASRYGSISKTLHWLIFIIMLGLLIWGFIMGEFQKPFMFTAYMWHKSTGLVVFALILARTIWVLTNPKPELPNAKAWERVVTKFTHFVLYILMLAMPLTGWIMSTAAGYNPSLYGYGSFAFPFVSKSEALTKAMSSAHSFIAWTIIVIVSLHILAALKHHFIDKDNILVRMLPSRR